MKRALVSSLFFISLAVWAGLPVLDFRTLPDPTSDLQAALHLAYEVWGPPLRDANRLAARDRITPDDFQVAVYLSSKSGWSLSVIWDMRKKGVEWCDVAARCGVPMDVVIVRPGRDYGPPYGKAWGYWKKQGEDRSFRLSDPEFVEMVRVHTLSRATGLSPDQVMEGLQGGRGYQAWAGDVYREKHGQGHGKGEPGQDKEHGQEGKGHGHDKKK